MFSYVQDNTQCTNWYIKQKGVAKFSKCIVIEWHLCNCVRPFQPALMKQGKKVGF